MTALQGKSDTHCPVHEPRWEDDSRTRVEEHLRRPEPGCDLAYVGILEQEQPSLLDKRCAVGEHVRAHEEAIAMRKSWAHTVLCPVHEAVEAQVEDPGVLLSLELRGACHPCLRIQSENRVSDVVATRREGPHLARR